MQYRMYTSEMNSFAVTLRIKQSCVGYMFEFVICATWVSMACHMQQCIQSSQVGSRLERTECVPWFHSVNFHSCIF